MHFLQFIKKKSQINVKTPIDDDIFKMTSLQKTFHSEK